MQDITSGNFFSIGNVPISERQWDFWQPEDTMQELAWLGRLNGEWLLVTGERETDMRKWADRELALRDLIDEGWTVTMPRLKAHGFPRHPRFLGYCLRRTIH